jgi:hypothetical protein
MKESLRVSAFRIGKTAVKLGMIINTLDLSKSLPNGLRLTKVNPPSTRIKHSYF